MCGRLSYSIPAPDLLATYPWLRDAPDGPARYNIAPTDPVLTVGPRKAEEVRWGIEGNRGVLFNLRSETALSRPHYHGLLLRHRVLVPMSHFYEWRKVGGLALPMAVSRKGGGILNLAALLGSWEDRVSVTILTTPPNTDIEPLHNRMPLVLEDDDAATWVLEELALEQVARLMKPCPEGWLRLAPASPLVNDVRNDGPQLLDPAALPPHLQLELIPPL